MKNTVPAHLNVSPVVTRAVKHTVSKSDAWLDSYPWLIFALQNLASTIKAWESLQVATEAKRLWSISNLSALVLTKSARVPHYL